MKNKNATSGTNIVRNMFWRFSERLAVRFVQLALTIILARLLEPNVYGSVALVTVFITILNVFIDSGLGGALIQKKNSDDLDFSTVFYFNIFFCLVLYALLFFAAPLIASFYKQPELTPVVRVVGITLLISGIKNIQHAYVSKHMLFKKFFFATLTGTIVSTIVSIVMAYYGFGVWALITQHLVNAFIDTIFLWFTVKWRPKLMFSFFRLKGLFSYGWKMLVSSLINTVYNELRQLLIGKIYTTSDLAFYNRGRALPKLVVANVDSALNSVLFPALSSVQDRSERLKQMMRRSMKTSTYILAPLLFGLAVCGEDVIRVLYTDKWLPAVPYLYIFCASLVFTPIHTSNLSAIKASGRSDLFLKLEIAKKTVGLIILFATIRISVLVLALSGLVTNIVFQIINSWPNRKLLNYTYGEQIKDIIPNLLLAAVMAGVVYCLHFIPMPSILRIVCSIILGAAFYISASKLLKLESYTYMIEMIKSFKKEFKKR